MARLWCQFIKPACAADYSALGSSVNSWWIYWPSMRLGRQRWISDWHECKQIDARVASDFYFNCRSEYGVLSYPDSLMEPAVIPIFYKVPSWNIYHSIPKAFSSLIPNAPPVGV